MDILKETINGIEYYLIDIYKTEFSFGTVYHFISKDNKEKFCFYKNNNYIPIKNKKYLKKINKELEISTDVLFMKNIINNEKHKSNSVVKERWDFEKEYTTYDEVSNIIHELFSDISYEETMQVLNDGIGIYSAYLEENTLGGYHHETKEIYIDKFLRNIESVLRTILHECIHKMTDRKGFLEKYHKYFAGLIEGATEKICEDKYGDKTSHIEVLDGKNIHINFSREASYPFQQVIYRQMSYILGTKKCDKSIINGEKTFFDDFSNLYGKELFLYLNHRCNRLLIDKLSENKKMEYFKDAQTMLFTKVFNKKLQSINTEEDIINYLNELRNFQYVIAKIEDDNTFEDYYNKRYSYLIQLAKQKGIDSSKIEKFEYSEVDFYPQRNYEKLRPFEITREHINNLLFIEKIDLSKCTRIQVEPSTNFFNLDIVLQNNIPISIVEDNLSFPICNIESDDEYFDIIKEKFKIEDNKTDIYNIAINTYMAVKDDGTSTIYFLNSETEETCILSKKEIDLGITSNDIEIERLKIENSLDISMSNFENKNRIDITLNSIKNRKVLLPEDSKFQDIDISSEIETNDNSDIKHSKFVKQLSPSNPIYNHSTEIHDKRIEKDDNKEIETKEEIDY